MLSIFFKALEESVSSIYPLFLIFWQIIKDWWWVPLPFILWKPFKFLYLWWRADIFVGENKRALFEIKIPKEINKPIRAMETVITQLWQILYDPPGNWWEVWIEGKFLLSYAFEIVLIDGQIKFYLRGLESHRHSIEAAIYSQFPEAEISIVKDYVKNVPSDIPNKEWDLWGADYRILKNDAYPIKTYKEFETESEKTEEAKVDPLSNLFEAASMLKPGEQIWIQILAGPVTEAEYPWLGEAKKLRDKLVHRVKEEPPKVSFFENFISVILTGKAKTETVQKEARIIPVEMELTPGERETVKKIEEKMSKPVFKTSIRFVYLGKREVFYKPKIRLPLSFFSAFTGLNSLVPYGQPFITKVVKSWFLPINLLRKRRTYIKQRAMFENYRKRVNPFYPKSQPANAKKKAVFILNTEEIATLFHFPSKRVAPAPFIERIEVKKREAPAGLPTDEE